MAYDYFGDRLRNPIEEHRRRVAYGVHLRFRCRDRSNPLDLSVEAFVELYRMPQDIFMELMGILTPFAERRQSPNAIPFFMRFLSSLFYYATGSYQEHTGTSIHHPLSQSSMVKNIEEITNLLNHPTILPRFVRFPWTNEERAAHIETTFIVHISCVVLIKIDFRNSRMGLPGVLGLIDGTLIPIFPPTKPNQHYYCRKRFTAINAAVICDANLKILYLDARYPGSAHDAYVYRWSPLRDALMRAYQGDQCWLLGIARWRCLFLPVHYSPLKAGKIINACAVLHNVMVDHGIPAPIDHPVFQDGQDPENILEPGIAGELPAHFLAEADVNRAHLVEHAHWYINRH
ncbi:hypothetical protein FOCC_FOCC009651 [Frankliniella occidentalis]|nr:hypothetical protein FOCC_FOCC009651 [Frankliniella occidentalis]